MKNAIEMMGHYHFSDFITMMFIVCAFVIGLEKVIKYVFEYVNKYHLKKLKEEESEKAIGDNQKQISDIVDKIEDLANLMNRQYLHLEKRLDEQKILIDSLDSTGTKRDQALLRDRILSGIRYFSQNKDLNGRVHIELHDYENMDSLFTEYFLSGGNGAVHKIYENEFKNWEIDN